MSRYVDEADFMKRIKPYDTDDPVDKALYNFAFNKMVETPTANVQQTLLGYPIEHLKLIAEVMRKENVTPEKVMEVLTDVGRIASMVRAEFEEQLRKAVERCWTN